VLQVITQVQFSGIFTKISYNECITHMMKLFNKNFFKFSFGFAGMLMFGMLGIIMTGYLDTSTHPESAMASDSQPIVIVEEEDQVTQN